MNRSDGIALQSFILVYPKKKTSSHPVLKPLEGGSSFIIGQASSRIEMVGLLRDQNENWQISEEVDHSQYFFYTGDNLGSGQDAPQECAAASAKIFVDMSTSQVVIYGSTVGLPPVFYCELPDKIIISTDIYLFERVRGFSYYFDVRSIHEVSRIGYPIDHKTLFKSILMLPAGHVLKLSETGQLNIQRQWRLPRRQYDLDWGDFIEAQKSAFRHAVQEMDLSSSFLSLTAGMDTRAILAQLVSNQKKINAYTMSGKTTSLDARTAAKLSAAYDIDHEIIVLHNAFHSGIADYCTTASRLTGGLSSLAQAHEVFFYEKVASGLKARISGNLGNQVGRGGAENVSLRNAGLNSLSDSIKEHTADELAHWYKPYLREGGRLAFAFLMEKEIPFSSVGNYALGNYFAMQKSPYANNQLIAVSRSRPLLSQQKNETSLLQMRIKDLRHRFLGESPERSFQLQLIKETGGPVAQIPINWGGKAEGGVSPSGLFLGMRAFIDAALTSKGLETGPIATAAGMFGISGLHDYRPHHLWLHRHMRSFCQDLFASDRTEESGLFKHSHLIKAANAYFDHQPGLHKHICFCLDLALAANVFNARMA